jgi:hypothetical protein
MRFVNVLLLLLLLACQHSYARTLNSLHFFQTITNPPQRAVFVREIENHHFERVQYCLHTPPRTPRAKQLYEIWGME